MFEHKVPFYSQYSHISIPEWQDRACGIVALKMLMDFWHTINKENKTDSLENLIGKGVDNGAYTEKTGWSHSGLVSVANNYGYDGFNKDLVPSGISSEDALEQIKIDLKYFPVISSVWKSFDPDLGGGHLIVVTGAHDGNIYLNDPADESIDSGQKTMTENGFAKAFKKRYIAIYPKNYLTRSDKLEIFNVNLIRSYLAMMRNSEGAKIFRNFYINTPQGEKDVLNNGELSCSAFVSFILYQWDLISDTHANVSSTVKDILGYGWIPIAKPKPGSIIEWESMVMADGSKHKHLGFYLGDNKAISNRYESGTPEIHHWTFGEKDGKPVRKIEKIYWNNKLNKK